MSMGERNDGEDSSMHVGSLVLVAVFLSCGGGMIGNVHLNSCCGG